MQNIKVITNADKLNPDLIPDSDINPLARYLLELLNQKRQDPEFEAGLQEFRAKGA